VRAKSAPYQANTYSTSSQRILQLMATSMRLNVLWSALILEAAAAFFIQRPWMTPDSRLYLELAQNLSEAGFVADGLPNPLRVPGYPWFLNVLIVRLGFSLPSVIAAQMALYLASVWIIAYRVVPPDNRLIFLLLTVFYPFPLFYSATLMSEALAIFCVALIVGLLCHAKSVVSYVLAGAMVGLGALLRTDLLPVIVAVVGVAWYRRQFAGAALSALAAFLVLLPYMIWNHYTFQRFTPVPVASTIGQSLYLASWESSLELEDLVYLSGGQLTERAEQSGFASEVRRLRPGGSEAVMKAAVERMKESPLDTALHSLNGTWRLLNTGHYPRFNWVLQIFSHMIWLLGLLGIFLAVIRQHFLVPLSVFLAVLIPHLPLHTEARYTASIRLILLLYAAIATPHVLAWLAQSFRPKKSA